MKQVFAFSQYESKKRVPAEEAMKHVYFRSLGPRIHTLPESKKLSRLFLFIFICLGLRMGMFRDLKRWLLISSPKILVLFCNQIIFPRKVYVLFFLFMSCNIEYTVSTH